MSRRVVITGMGIYSCIGIGLEQVRESLYEGRSGIGLDLARREMGYRSSLTGIIPKPELKGMLDRRNRVALSEHASYAYVATREALDNASIDERFLAENSVGIIYGNDSTAQGMIDGIDVLRSKYNTALIGQGNVFQSLGSTVSMNLSVIFGLKGVNFTLAGACASGSHSIGMAYVLIKQGLQDCVVCGGAEEVNVYSVCSFDGLGVFSAREDEPHKASRPFDSSRDGLVPSGGAATVILESYDSAVKRGAPIIAEVIGYGFSSNGDHLSIPNVEGPAQALEMAVKDAGIEREQIQYINAHATSTPVGDMKEAQAIRRVFGGHRPYVTSTKGQTGHEMWMAGASEIVYSSLMMEGGFIAPNLNYEKGDEASSLLNIPSRRVDVQFDTFLSNSFGFGGTNATLIVKKIKR